MYENLIKCAYFDMIFVSFHGLCFGYDFRDFMKKTKIKLLIDFYQTVPTYSIIWIQYAVVLYSKKFINKNLN